MRLLFEAGLATDIELVEEYPSQISAFYMRRKHRWVRGDWQIAQWMFSRVYREESGGRSRQSYLWHIALENFRQPAPFPGRAIHRFALFIAGWLGLPGGPLYWTISPPCFCCSFPPSPSLRFALRPLVHWRPAGSGSGRRVFGFQRGARGSGPSCLFAARNFARLRRATSAVRSLVRRFSIMGERLLEWESAAQDELQSPARAHDDAGISPPRRL